MAHHFHIYKSSAGSGKTYTLVKEYLKIVLLDPSKVKHILAITFTNAAASEMKDRIIQELNHIASLSINPDNKKARKLLDQIRAEWQEQYHSTLPEEIAIQNAGQVLKQILHKYSEFSVSTIDSFVHRVIRTFAFDLYLPFHFDVELDAGALLSQATDMLISRAGTDKNLTALLISFLLNQADEEKDLRIETMIASMGATLMDEEGSSSISQLKEISLDAFLDIAKKIKALIAQYEHSVKTIAGEACQAIASQGLSAADFYRGNSGIGAYFLKLSKHVDASNIMPNSYVRTTISDDKWFAAKADKGVQEAILAIHGQLRESVFRITGHDHIHIQAYKVYLAIGKHIFQVAVLNELEKVLEEIKKDNVILHISDFNKKIAEIIADQPVPFIYERLGERYHHYMIDEFQDTSGLQWNNLLPLVDNALATGQLSLVVGDGKQAIYRFRNGDVEQFAMLPKLGPGIRSAARSQWEQTLVANAKMNPLKTNYRSLQEIVSFNNRFFKHTQAFLSEELKPIYEDAAQLSLPAKTGGYVEILFADKENLIPVNPSQTNPSQTNPSPSNLMQPEIRNQDTAGEQDPSIKQATLNYIMATIERLRGAGHPLSDITILCRANHEASLVARTLLGNQVPVISSDSLLLNQSDDVNFILSFVRLLSDPYNQVAATEIIAYLHTNNRLQNQQSLHECLVDAGLSATGSSGNSRMMVPAIERLMRKNNIDLSFSAFYHQNLYDICETIIRKFFSGITPPSPFVAFFSDVLFDYAAKNTMAVADFLAWWDANSKNFSLVVPPGIDAIQVMTIHRSKGLQFPVVVIPFASHDLSQITKKGHWVDVDLPEIPELKTTWISLSASGLAQTPFESLHTRELAKSYLDTLNMMYVAFTRAENKLFVITKKSKSYKSSTIHGLLQDFLAAEGQWQEDQMCYTFGHFDSMQQAIHDAANLASTTNERNTTADDAIPWPDVLKPAFVTIPSAPWSKALRMKSHQTERNPETGNQDYLERGNLLHRAMENIQSHDDIAIVLDAMLANGEIDNYRKQEWVVKIKQLIDLPEIEPYFAKNIRVKPEAGIFDQNGNFFRPDRVVLLENETVVIDYKTGRQYEKHKSQMETYANLLRQMGYANVKKCVLYLDQGKVVVY